MYSKSVISALRILILLGCVLFAQSASASFHLWSLSKLYSDASGTVQYIELSTSAGGQEFVGGHAISASQGSLAHTFIFPADLPGDTAGRSFLIGTQGFANLGIVTPDYIVPNGFLFLANGSVDFAGVDSVTYRALPIKGAKALDRGGSSIDNAPTNFAGVTAPITLPAQTSISNTRVFVFAEANYPDIFTGSGTAGQYQQYNYRYYPASGNYLAIDTSGVISILGPYTGNAITSVGPVESFRNSITAWEAVAAPISDTRVFAYEEATSPGIFTGAGSAGQYQQYDYRYYPTSGNYLAVDTAGVISIFGPYTGNAITSIGPVESFRNEIAAWEAAH